MLIAIVENNIITQIGDHKHLFKGTDFGDIEPDSDFLKMNSAYQVLGYKNYDPLTQKLEHCIPYIEEDKVYSVKVVFKNQEDIDNDRLIRASEIREQRNQYLSESDWTMTIDAPVDQRAWKIYRQALRDITSQANFPDQVIWPDKP